MSHAYWDQWSHSEIMSMHGVELDEIHEEEYADFYFDEDEECLEEEQEVI